MLYLNENDIGKIGIDWPSVITVIREACHAMARNDYAQPVKPYLRYRNRKNRIIAMPGFVGGETELAGIKWIASFPDNIHKGIRRAHSITILNDAGTGQPIGIINTPLISGIRTAGVSGLMVERWMEHTRRDSIKLGMTGWGPIGRLHAEMLFAILGDRVESMNVYDIRPRNKETAGLSHPGKIRFCDSWQEAFKEADIFVTCTVSDKPYINSIPKKGSLHLNVSLRDYEASWIKYADMIIVDDWEEVCREGTDIEMMHLNYGLSKDQVYNIVQIVTGNDLQKLSASETVMFNPMGMSVFDIAVAANFLNTARKAAIGTYLD